MYDTNDEFRFLTENEKLFEKISHNRLIDLINSDTMVLVCEGVSCNSYGEFMFITLKHKDNYISLYGLGYHEYRDMWLANEWHIAHYGKEKDFALPERKRDKRGMLKEIEDYRQKIVNNPNVLKHKQSKRGGLFQELADIGDDDSTISLMEEYEDMFEDSCENDEWD